MAAVVKYLGCIMRNTRLSGGVSGCRERTAPKLEAVIRKRRSENHSGHIRCSLVFLSISLADPCVTSRFFWNAAMVCFRSVDCIIRYDDGSCACSVCSF